MVTTSVPRRDMAAVSEAESRCRRSDVGSAQLREDGAGEDIVKLAWSDGRTGRDRGQVVVLVWEGGKRKATGFPGGKS
jgi:hypothetical protein